MMQKFTHYIYVALTFSLFLWGCAPMGQLGGKANHHYFANPKRIVVIQIPGLSHELLSLLKLSKADANWSSSWESVVCLGQAWAFNLYSLRPTPFESTMSTITGSMNINQDRCALTERVPLWAPYVALGHDVHIVERGIPHNDSLQTFFDCPQKLWDIRKITMWSMSRPTSETVSQFHFQQNKDYTRGDIYYDRSCNEQGCFSTLEQNLDLIFKQIENHNKFFNFVLIRDWTVWNLLEKKQLSSLQNELVQWDILIKKIIERAESDQNDGTVIVTGDSSIPVELPLQGKDWKEVLKNGKGLVIHRSSVMTPVWVWGARAENFCGTFHQSEIARKLF